MNLNLCKKYYLGLGKLISDISGKEYEFDLEDDDRFYIYMKQHINNGKVNDTTRLKIDQFIITDPDKTFLDEKTFTLNAKMFVDVCVAKEQVIIYAYDFEIKGISIIIDGKFHNKYDNGEWLLSMCDLSIPRNTKITVSEIN